MIALQTLAQPRSSSALPARPESPDRLRQLERLVWRYGNAMPAAGETTRATGFAELDRTLPQHGWFADGLNELLGNEQGAGEFSLLLPALAQACAAICSRRSVRSGRRRADSSLHATTAPHAFERSACSAAQ
jgi:hypothetical protein